MVFTEEEEKLLRFMYEEFKARKNLDVLKTAMQTELRNAMLSAQTSINLANETALNTLKADWETKQTNLNTEAIK